MIRRWMCRLSLLALLASTLSGCGGSSAPHTKSTFPDPEGGAVPKPGGAKAG
jgi:hypothetical protein